MKTKKYEEFLLDLCENEGIGDRVRDITDRISDYGNKVADYGNRVADRLSPGSLVDYAVETVNRGILFKTLRRHLKEEKPVTEGVGLFSCDVSDIVRNWNQMESALSMLNGRFSENLRDLISGKFRIDPDMKTEVSAYGPGEIIVKVTYGGWKSL